MEQLTYHQVIPSEESPQTILTVGWRSLFNISAEAFEAIIKAGLSLDQIYILEKISVGEDVAEYMDNSKIRAWKVTLLRKGLIKDDNTLTETGKAILGMQGIVEGLKQKKEIVKKAKSETIEAFDKWWKVYPASDMFEYKGTKFDGTQSKKIKKEVCKLNFDRIVVSGIKAQDIIDATEFHIEMAKQASIKKGVSQLSFIPNSERYLREECFMPFIGKRIQKQEETKMVNPEDLFK